MSSDAERMGRAAPSDSRAAPARVLMPTIRRLNPHAAWCSNYEFEDVARAVDDVDLLELQPAPASQLRQRLARSVAWRGKHPAFTHLNPGVKPVTVRRDYDLFVFVCMNMWDLLYLNAIHDWKARCRVKVCYITEFYGGYARQYDHFLRRLADFDHVAQPFSGSLAEMSRALGRPCHHLPLAADVRRFTPYPDPPRRVIDVLSVGRRSEPVHQELLRLAASHRFFYLHDTIPGPLIRPSRPAEHRDMLANSAKRSRFFIAYPAKFGDEETRGQSEVGARYFEGTAAGTILLGQAPTAPAFRDDFPWPDAVVEPRLDGADVAEILARFDARPEEAERVAERNAVAALRRHDWGHRWQSILRVAGASPRPGLAERLRALEALADEASCRPVTP